MVLFVSACCCRSYADILMYAYVSCVTVVWCNGGALVSINEVNLSRARLVLGWVTMSGFNSQCGTYILICNQLPRPTQPGHPFTGSRNWYQPKGRYGSYVGGR